MERLGTLPPDVQAGLGEGLTIQAAFVLSSENDAFGGLSGLWIAPDGSEMIAVSDNGQRWQARLHHDTDGRLTGADRWSVTDLPLGSWARKGSSWRDAEALTLQAPDRLVLAYEGEHRLARWSLDDLDAMPERLAPPDGLGGRSNSGIEALATLEDGRLFALAERVGAWGGEGLMGWLIGERAVQDFIYLPGPGGFAPTGAARLEGVIYVVERSFSLLGGFRTRIVTLPSDAAKPGARLEGRERAAFRWGEIGQNFEGIEARNGPNGQVSLYLLADDNFSFLQETLLVQLSLIEGRSAADGLD